MKSYGAFLVLLGSLTALAVGVTVVFRLRLATGDVFPAYSSQRADPLGTRALYEALDRMPAVQVNRHLRPLPLLPPTPSRTILLAGVSAEAWKHSTRDELDALDAAVRAGSRLVIALTAKASEPPEPEETPVPKKPKAKPAKETPSPGTQPVAPKIVYIDPGQRWGVDLKDRWLVQNGGGAVRADEPGTESLPARMSWNSDLYFAPSANAGWRTIYRRGGMPVLIERNFGRGSIVLAADSYFLSNEALLRDREGATEGTAPAANSAPVGGPRLTSLISWVIGPNTDVLFDESHLGVLEHPGVAALARRYGLAGAFLTLVLLAVLFAWQQMALFVPPVEETSEMSLAYHPAAGLEALLRRSVPPAEIVTACAAEWRRTAGENERARLDAALAAAPGQTAVGRYNAAVRALRKGRK